MEVLKELDHYIFFIINNRLHNASFDRIAPYWRSMYLWIPLYCFFIGYLALNFRKLSLPYLIFLSVVVAVSDTTSSKIIKPLVHRPRPCSNESREAQIKLLITCGSGYSFPSSHAANHFAGVIFILLTFANLQKTWKLILIAWAASIALAQIYVGVHYPSDVAAGTALGVLIGFIGARAYKYLFKAFVEIDYYT